MAVYKVPRELSAGFLTIGGTDVTDHIRQVEFEEDQPTIDIGVVSDPSATALGRLGREVTLEFVNSFTDDATGGTDGIHDILETLADGSEKACVFQPFGTGTTKPKWEWNTEIGYAPIGLVGPDQPNIIEITIPVRSLVYTAAEVP